MMLQGMVIAVAVGLAAGYLADFLMKGRGYGLMGDVLLGVGGSLVGGWVYHVLVSAPGTGWFAMVAVAFVGAVIFIVGQRMFWQVRT